MIADLVTAFRSKLATYTPVVNLLEDSSGVPTNQKGAGGAALVTLGMPGPVDSRIMRFDAVTDMPADITNSGNVSGDRIELTGFASTARRVLALWHGAGIAGPDTQGTQQFFGEVALGAMLIVNADDDTDANGRLVFTDLTGGGSSSAGVEDRFMVSKSAPFIDITLTEAISRIDVIGVPNGLSTTHLDVILPCFLELRIIG